MAITVERSRPRLLKRTGEGACAPHRLCVSSPESCLRLCRLPGYIASTRSFSSLPVGYSVEDAFARPGGKGSEYLLPVGPLGAAHKRYSDPFPPRSHPSGDGLSQSGSRGVLGRTLSERCLGSEESLLAPPLPSGCNRKLLTLDEVRSLDLAPLQVDLQRLHLASAE